MAKKSNTKPRSSDGVGNYKFIALRPRVGARIADSSECAGRGDAVMWGSRDDYPQYLEELYESVPTLASVINGAVDYTCGDNVESTAELQGSGVVNTSGEAMRDVVEALARDRFLFGGFAILVHRNEYTHEVVSIEALPLQNLRTDENKEVFYYRKYKSGRGIGKSYDEFQYPRFMVGGEALASVVYVGARRTRVYPTSPFASAVKSCEIERQINEYHLSEIENGFSSGTIITMYNGIPADENKQQIEESFSEKFTGAANAGRPMISFADDKEHGLEVTTLDVKDFGNKYQMLAKRSAQQIYTSFRAHPNLFGIPTENKGFSAEEYAETFALFNKTTIQPAQRQIVEALNKILGEGAVSITPFSIYEPNKTVE